MSYEIMIGFAFGIFVGNLFAGRITYKSWSYGFGQAILALFFFLLLSGVFAPLD